MSVSEDRCKILEISTSQINYYWGVLRVYYQVLLRN